MRSPPKPPGEMRAGDGFKQPPEDNDYEFWACAAATCNHRHATLLAIDSSELCAAVHEELEVIDLTEVCEGQLFLGNLSALESPIALKMLSIGGVIAITDDDHILASIATACALPTHPVTPAAELSEQIRDCASFARGLNGACLICSTTGNDLAAATCAGVLAARDKLSAAMALTQVEKKRGPLRISSADFAALQAFCDWPTPPPPPPLLVVSSPAQPSHRCLLPLICPRHLSRRTHGFRRK